MASDPKKAKATCVEREPANIWPVAIPLIFHPTRHIRAGEKVKPGADIHMFSLSLSYTHAGKKEEEEEEKRQTLHLRPCSPV